MSVRVHKDRHSLSQLQQSDPSLAAQIVEIAGVYDRHNKEHGPGTACRTPLSPAQVEISSLYWRKVSEAQKVGKAEEEKLSPLETERIAAVDDVLSRVQAKMDKHIDTVDLLIPELQDLGHRLAAIETDADKQQRLEGVSEPDIAKHLTAIYGDKPLPAGAHILVQPVFERVKGVDASARDWGNTVDQAVDKITRLAEKATAKEADSEITHIATCPVTFKGRPGAAHPQIPDRRGPDQPPVDAKESTILDVYAALVDLDGEHGSPQAALEKLLAAGLRPSMVIASGGLWRDGKIGAVFPKIHCYYILTGPARGADLPRVGAINRRLAASFDGDMTFGSRVGHNLRAAGQWHRKGVARLGRVIYSDGPRYPIDGLTAMLDRFAPEVKKEQTHKEWTQNADELEELYERIITGDDTHEAMGGVAFKVARLGWTVPPICRTIRACLDQRGGTGKQYSDHEIEKRVREIVDKVQESESWENSEEWRRKIVIVRAKNADNAWQDHKAAMIVRVDALTPASVANGLGALDDLFNEIGLLRDIEEKTFWVDRIRTKLGKGVNGWSKDIRAKLERGISRAFGMLKADKKQNKEVEKAAATEKQDPDLYPNICFTTMDNDLAIERAWKAVAAYNKKAPKIFHHAMGGLARLDEDSDGFLVIKAFADTHMSFSNEMKHVARWVVPIVDDPDPEDEEHWRNATPPTHILGDMMAEPATGLRARGIPRLAAVIATPGVAKDGTIDVVPGYKPELEACYQPAAGFVVPDVPTQPTEDDVDKALDWVLANALEGFAFRDLSDPVQHRDDVPDMDPLQRRLLYGRASRANALAALLTFFATQLYNGATPLFALNKTQRRSGASKFAGIISLIALGKDGAFNSLPQHDEEMRKVITTHAISGSRLLIFDNVPMGHILDSNAFAAMFTSPRWRDRILATNKTAECKVNWMTFVTGNNLMMSAELADRAVSIRQAPGVPRPDERTDFKHVDLEGWVKQNQAQLVWSCLTLVRYWVAMGARRDRSIVFGGFTDWAQVMGGILNAIGVDGFMANRREITTGVVNTERTQLEALLSAWLQQWPPSPVVPRDDEGRFATAGVKVGDPTWEISDGTNPHKKKCGGILRLMEDNEINVDGVHLGEPKAAQSVMGLKLGGYRNQVVEIEQRRVIKNTFGTVERHEARMVAVEIESYLDRHTKTTLWRLVGKPTTAWAEITGA